jgi:hypothetical protein
MTKSLDSIHPHDIGSILDREGVRTRRAPLRAAGDGALRGTARPVTLLERRLVGLNLVKTARISVPRCAAMPRCSSNSIGSSVMVPRLVMLAIPTAGRGPQSELDCRT